MTTMLARSLAFGLLLVFAASLPGAAEAHDYKLGPLEIEHPWARPSTGKTGAAYFVIRNDGKSDDALLKVECARAAKVQVHEMKMDGAIMRMRAVERLAIPAGGAVSVAPGGLHVMLVGLTGPLKDGEAFPMTLVFEKAGSIVVSVKVETPAATPDAGHGMGGMPGMSGMH
jgi:copper(I)-binding protein